MVDKLGGTKAIFSVVSQAIMDELKEIIEIWLHD